MPYVRKVSSDEAARWGVDVTDQLFKQITGGDAQGITRLKNGWRVEVINHRHTISVEFVSPKYRSSVSALRAAVEARALIREAMHDAYDL